MWKCVCTVARVDLESHAGCIVFLLPGVRSGMSSGSRMDRDKVLTEDEGIDDVEREWNRGQDVTFDSFPGRNLN